ncbi:MAG: leucine-rich repeat protein [Clostridia bacterium]|nr:leucine-rich repeat protein [Clostridia bacterium]
MKEVKCKWCLNNLGHDYSLKYCRFCGASLLTDVDYLAEEMPPEETYNGKKAETAGGCDIINGVLVRCDAKEAVIPDGVTAISEYAFDNDGVCAAEIVFLPASVRAAEEGAFFLDSLEFIGVSLANKKFKSADGILLSRDGEYLLRCPCGRTDSVITVPDGVKYLGNAAFAYCRYIEEIILPDSVQFIGDYCFKECESLKKINIPQNVGTIGNHAFEHCDCLESISLPDKLEVIGSDAFRHCESLAEISMPKGLKCVSGNAFAYCHLLKKVNLNEGLEFIGYKAFENCRGLSDIKIPASVVAVRRWTFDGCENLRRIYCEAAAKPDGWDGEWKCNFYGDGRGASCKAKVTWNFTGEIPVKKKKEFKESQEFSSLKAKAEGGDLQSQYMLAERYLRGDGVKKSYKSAFGWYKNAADGGYTPAICGLGYCYLFTLGVKRDYGKALELFAKAAGAGDERAEFLLGYCRYFGVDGEQNAALSDRADREEAVKLFASAASKGYSYAKSWLAYCMYNGKGLNKDEGGAEKLYEAAAKDKCRAAILWHMENYTDFIVTEEGFRLIDYVHPAAPDNLAKLKKLAEGGDSYMQYALACRYDERGDYPLAFKWFKRSAEGGDCEAMYRLAGYYGENRAYGEDGCPDLRDHSTLKAKWYARSAEQGYYRAIEKFEENTEINSRLFDGATDALRGVLNDLSRLSAKERQKFFRTSGKKYQSSADDDMDD